MTWYHVVAGGRWGRWIRRDLWYLYVVSYLFVVFMTWYHVVVRF